MIHSLQQSTDQMVNQITFTYPPQRIISLVPSQTELLFYLGLDDKIVGITKFCVHPEDKVKGKTKVGGTKKFDFETIDKLQPDLIIGNKEENYKAGIERLKKKYPVWMSDIYTLEEAYDMMISIGRTTGKAGQAESLVREIKERFNGLNQNLSKKVLYFIWKDPLMSVGGDTFIHEMLEICGFDNLLKHESRYPQLSINEVRDYNPDLILLSSEPYPFQEKHVSEFKELCPTADIAIVDGELFSWYGSRLKYSVEYFKTIKNELLKANY